MPANFPPDVNAIGIAIGTPQPASLPQGVNVGEFGWELEQAQGTTPTFAAGLTLIDFAANTADRIGPLLDDLDASAHPEVWIRTNRIKILVSASVLDVTDDFLSDLMAQLRIRHKSIGARDVLYSVQDAIQTPSSGGRAATTVAATTINAPQTAQSWANLGLGVDVYLRQDTFRLEVMDAVPLPTGATVRLQVWFEGLLVSNELSSRAGGKCDTPTQAQIANLARVRENRSYFAK